MKWTARHVYIAMFTFLLGIVAWLVYSSNGFHRDMMFDQFEAANPTFKIRVTAYNERFVFPPGSYYAFESAPSGSNVWKTIITVPTDQAEPIPRNQIQFVNNHIAYIFFGSYYMVTIDGGGTWLLWDANKELPVEQFMKEYNLWPAIKEVELKADGTGKMTLSEIQKERGKGPALFTTNYGQHWSIR